MSIPTLRANVFARRRTCSMAVLAFASLAASSEAATWFTNPANGHQYALTSQKTTWTGAQAEAAQNRAYLTTLTSLAEHNWVVNKFGTGNLGALTFNDFWIGLTDVGRPPGNWYWVNGEPFSYTNWRPGNPDLLSIERYVMSFQGLWDNRTNGNQAYSTFGPDAPFRPVYGIMERGRTRSNPEPASMISMAVGFVGLAWTVARRRRRAA